MSSLLLKVTFQLTVLCMFNACQMDDNNINGIVGSKAPYFNLTTSEGNQVNLFDYKDKVVILFFFGNGTESSKKAAVNVQSDLVVPYTNKNDVVVLGLDYWNGDMLQVRAFKNSTNVTYPLLLDASNTVTNYKSTYDRLVIIDKNGTVIFSGTQDATNDIAAVKQQVDKLLLN